MKYIKTNKIYKAIFLSFITLKILVLYIKNVSFQNKTVVEESSYFEFKMKRRMY